MIHSAKRTITFLISIIVFFILSYILFYHQASSTGESFPSDMYCYVDYINGQESDLISYPLFFWFAKIISLLTSAEIAVAIALSILNSLTVIFLYIFFQRQVDKKQSLVIIVVPFALCFISPLYFPAFNPYLYLGQWSPNPWQNATTLAMRPFAILAYYFFLESWSHLHQKIEKKNILFFSLSLFLSTLTKPTFAFVFLPAAGICIIFDFFKNRCAFLKNTLFIGLSVLPTILLLLKQYLLTFQQSSSAEGISISPGTAWGHYSPNILVSIILACAFPLSIFFAYLKHPRLTYHKVFSLSYGMLFIGILEAIFLNEKGLRQFHGNFIWPYIIALFFSFTASIPLWYHMKKSWYKSICSLLLFLHIITGLIYFIRIFGGYPYN